MENERADKIEYYLLIAEAVAGRGDLVLILCEFCI